MAEYASSRRRQEMGADEYDKDMREAERAAAKGEEIERKKREKREALEKDPVYNACAKISKVMDKYMLDPILGLIPGGVGDLISQALTLPFIYVSFTKIKSIPLTLSIIYNSLKDILVGAIPVIGDVFDVFSKSHRKNYQLLSGFIEENEEVKKKVNKDATKCGVLILVLMFLIYLVIKLVASITGYVFDHISDLFLNAGDFISGIYNYILGLF